MSTTLKSKILAVTRRTTKGFTVGEIYDRVHACNFFDGLSSFSAPYNSVRARVYELCTAGKLLGINVRKDTVSGRLATTFVRNN